MLIMLLNYGSTMPDEGCCGDCGVITSRTYYSYSRWPAYERISAFDFFFCPPCQEDYQWEQVEAHHSGS